MPLEALSHTTAVVFQESNEAHYKDQETGAELEVIEKMPLLEWLANSYKKFGCQLEFVTNKSQVCYHPSCPCTCSLKPVLKDCETLTLPPMCAFLEIGYAYCMAATVVAGTVGRAGSAKECFSAEQCWDFCRKAASSAEGLAASGACCATL